MKKRTLVAFATFLTISTLSAFEDKPALSTMERAALYGSKGLGATVGGAAGGASVIRKARHFRKNLETITQKYTNIPLDRAYISSSRRNRHYEDRALLGTGVAAGGYAGYKAGESAAIAALARLHGVSYRVESISQYYNINVPQYKKLLLAAQSKNMNNLLPAIETVYTQRFGSDWKDRLPMLIKKYSRNAQDLFKRGSFNLNGAQKEFARMVELGAAMANLFYSTNPNSKKAYDSAVKLYKELGLL